MWRIISIYDIKIYQYELIDHIIKKIAENLLNLISLLIA